MFKYIVNSKDNDKDDFMKFSYLDEVKHYIGQLEQAKNSDTTNLQPFESDVHVYRIKDIKDAISTSVIMEGNQKAEYLQMLTSENSKMKATSDFYDICKNVGECDIY